MVTTPTKEAQAAESRARAEAGNAIPAGETAAALDVATDSARLDPGTNQPAQRAAAEAEPHREPPRSRGDMTRDEIAKRFRSGRNAQAETDRDEISDFARVGLPPDFVQATTPEPDPALEPEPQDEPALGADDQPAVLPQMVKITVRGVEKEVTLAEALSLAQIAAAADDTLEQAKSKYKEIDTLLEQARNQVQRADLPGKHHAQGNGTQTAESDQPAGDDVQHQDDISKLIDTIRFGDDKEAADLLRNTIAQAAPKPEQVAQTVQQEMLASRLRDEGARAGKVLKDFSEKNPELANDPMARAAMEVSIYEQQVEDLKQLGLDPNRIRQDGQPPTPGDIANAHRYYRVSEGFNLSSPEKMLETAKEKVMAWRGVKAPNPADPALNKGAPRIDVSVDRNARRAAIPQQPSRTNAPRTPAQPAPQPRDRASIVAAEKARRAALRGQNLGT